MNNILILGGTGAMGKYLTQLLADRSRIVVTTRKKRTSLGNVSYIQGDAHDLCFLKLLLNDNFDVIIDFMGYTTDEFRKRFLLLLDSCKQYMFLSSARVYSGVDGLITEETPRLLDVCMDEEYLATDEYALAKARQEDMLKNSERNNWTIIRLYITYGENRLQLGVLEKERWLYRAIHGRTVIFSEDIGDKFTTLTYGYDVARGIFSLIGQKEALGEIFHITSNKSLRWSEVLDIYLSAIADKIGKKPKVLYLNEYPVFSWQVSKDRIYNRRFDTNKIGNFIDISTFADFNDGLKKCIANMIENPLFEEISWREEAYFDYLSSEYSTMSEMSCIKQQVKYLFYRLLVYRLKRILHCI